MPRFSLNWIMAGFASTFIRSLACAEEASVDLSVGQSLESLKFNPYHFERSYWYLAPALIVFFILFLHTLERRRIQRQVEEKQNFFFKPHSPPADSHEPKS